MKTDKGTFKFTVPADSPREDQRGEKLEVPFTFPVCETDEDVAAIVSERKTSVLEIVNGVLKDRAKSSAYQSLLASHKPADLSPEDALQGIIRTLVRSGLSVEKATERARKMMGE
jgi:hypothetical protein